MNIAKTIKRRVYKPNPTTGNTFPGDEHTGIKPAIRFYKLYVNDESDRGEESEIFIKIYISQEAFKLDL